MSELDPNNVQDGITMWQLGGGTFLGLLGVIAALIKSRFNRLVRRVEVIEENYVKDSQIKKAMIEMERLNEKFDEKTDEVINNFNGRHDILSKKVDDNQHQIITEIIKLAKKE